MDLFKNYLLSIGPCAKKRASEETATKNYLYSIGLYAKKEPLKKRHKRCKYECRHKIS